MIDANCRLGRTRLMEPADLEMVRQWRNHENVRRFMFSQQEISHEAHRRWFDQEAKDVRSHLLILEVGVRASGFIRFRETAAGGIADWGFYVSPAAPAGTGRLLGQYALEHAFVQLQLHKICGRVLVFNERSIRFHNRCGFTQEGVLREQHFDGNAYHDVVRFGLLTSDWQSHQKGGTDVRQ